MYINAPQSTALFCVFFQIRMNTHTSEISPSLSALLMTLTSTISVAKVREPPDVSKADTVADTGEQKLILAAPLLPRKLGVCCRYRRGLVRHCLRGSTGCTMRNCEAIRLCWTLQRKKIKFCQIHFCISTSERKYMTAVTTWFFWKHWKHKHDHLHSATKHNNNSFVQTQFYSYLWLRNCACF